MRTITLYIIGLLLTGCITVPQHLIDMELPDIRYQYSEIRDEGFYLTNMINHLSQNQYNINSTAYIRCDQPIDCEPEFVTIDFYINMSTWVTEPAATINFLADGERLSFSDNNPGYSAGLYSRYESAKFIIPFNQFEHIASADSVRAEISYIELDFSFENRKLFRELIHAVNARDVDAYYWEPPTE